MVRFLLSFALLVLCVSAAEAGPFRRTTRSVTTTQASTCVGGQCGSPAATATVRQRTVTVTRGGTAQADAEAMAASGVMRHCGHNGGQYEGVGFSTSSADDAVSRCCYWGQKQPAEIGVARGSRGWFACVLYR
jgi:hypothetical protein